MYELATSDRYGKLFEMNTTDPYSPIARAKARPVPVRIDGISVGNVMVRKTRAEEAPSVAAAASALKVSDSSTGCTERTVNGSVTNMIAMVMPIHEPVTLTWTGDSGP